MFQITRSIFELFLEKTGLRVWHIIWILGFVKGTRGYVEKTEPKPCF